MNDELVYKGTFEGTEFGPWKYSKFRAAPTVDQTMACMHLYKRHVLVRDWRVSQGNKQRTSQHTRITMIVELVHRRPFAY